MWIFLPFPQSINQLWNISYFFPPPDKILPPPPSPQSLNIYGLVFLHVFFRHLQTQILIPKSSKTNLEKMSVIQKPCVWLSWRFFCHPVTTSPYPSKLAGTLSHIRPESHKSLKCSLLIPQTYMYVMLYCKCFLTPLRIGLKVIWHICNIDTLFYPNSYKYSMW